MNNQMNNEKKKLLKNLNFIRFSMVIIKVDRKFYFLKLQLDTIFFLMGFLLNECMVAAVFFYIQWLFFWFSSLKLPHLLNSQRNNCSRDEDKNWDVHTYLWRHYVQFCYIDVCFPSDLNVRAVYLLSTHVVSI